LGPRSNVADFNATSNAAHALPKALHSPKPSKQKSPYEKTGKESPDFN
jgi:hypothetical protein